MNVYPHTSGCPCVAHGGLCSCTLKLVHAHVYSPCGTPVVFAAAHCVDCKTTWQVGCHLPTKNVNAFALAASSAVMDPRTIHAMIPFVWDTSRTGLHFCSCLSKFMDGNGVPHFRCNECMATYPWHINTWVMYNDIPEGVVPVQLVMNLFHYQGVGKYRQFYRIRHAAVALQTWWRTTSHGPAPEEKQSTRHDEKDPVHAAITIHRFLYMCKIRRCRERIARAVVAIQARLRRRASNHRLALKRARDQSLANLCIKHVRRIMRRAWQRLVEQTRTRRRERVFATKLQCWFRTWSKKKRAAKRCRLRRATSRLAQVVNTALKKHVFGMFKWMCMAPKHAAARMIQSTFCCYTKRKRDKRRLEKQRQRRKRRKKARKQRKLEQKAKAKPTEPEKSTPKPSTESDGGVGALPHLVQTRISDGVLVDHIAMFNEWLETMAQGRSMSTNAKALLYAVCVRATAVLGRFMKKTIYTTPPFRATHLRVHSIRSVLHSVKPCGEETCASLDGVRINFITYSFVLARTKQVVRCLLPSRVLLALCVKGMVPDYDVIMAYYLQILIYVCKTAAMTTAIIGRDYVTSSLALLNPTTAQFAGIEASDAKYTLPTILGEAMDDLAHTPCDDFGSYCAQDMVLCKDAVREHKCPFVYIDTAHVVKPAHLFAVTTVTSLAHAMASAVYMLASDFNQGSEYPQRGVGQRLRDLNKLPWSTSDKTLWEACVDVECARKSLANPEKNRLYMSSRRRLRQLKMPTYPSNMEKFAAAFAMAHACDSKPVRQHIFSKLRDLAATLRIGYRKNGKDIACHFRPASHHVDAILMVLHFGSLDFFVDHTIGDVADHLVKILCGMQQLFCMESHPVTGQIKVNADMTHVAESTAQVLMFWSSATLQLQEIVNRVKKAVDAFVPPFDPSQKVTLVALNTPCEDQTPENKTRTNRLDLQATTCLLRLVQIFLGELVFGDPQDCMNFLFTLACVVLQQPHNAKKMWHQLRSTFFKTNSYLREFMEGMFGQEPSSDTNTYTDDGKAFLGSVRRILGCH